MIERQDPFPQLQYRCCICFYRYSFPQTSRPVRPLTRVSFLPPIDSFYSRYAPISFPYLLVRISCLCFDLRFGYVGCGKNWKVSAGRITLQPVQIERERAALGSASEDDACAMYHPSDSSYSRCGAFFSE